MMRYPNDYVEGLNNISGSYVNTKCTCKCIINYAILISKATRLKL